MDRDDIVSRLSKSKCIVTREEVIPNGRLDLVVRFERKAILLVEVMVGIAEESEFSQIGRYANWLAQQGCEYRRAVLVCLDAFDHGSTDMVLVRWEDICLNLRRLIPHLLQRRRVVTAAMALAFVGAVEQNLLKLQSVNSKSKPGYPMQIPRTVAHLERSLKGG